MAAASTAAAGGAEGVAEGDAERTVMASSIARLSAPGVVVQFTIEPDGYIQPVEFPLTTVVRDLKLAIAQDLGIPPTHLVLRFFGRVALAASTLHECGLERDAKAGRVVDGNVVIDPTQTGEDYVMPDTLVVTVVNDETGDVDHEVIVRVERDPTTLARPFMGGFRDKRTGLEYHHFATQTDHVRESRWAGAERKLSRETQTATTITRSQQTKREASTQSARTDLHVDETRDRILIPGPYLTADELDEIRSERATVIQRCWRGHSSRQRADAIRSERAAATQAREDAEAAAASAATAAHKAAVARRLHPRTAEDFALLYGEIEAWRQAEVRSISDSDMNERERHEALARVLDKQTRMLASVDRLRTAARHERTHDRVHRILDSMAKPRRWELGDGTVAEVHTPLSTRAQELKALYESLTAKPASPEQRLDALLQVKWTVKEFDCGLTREIVELIDREADLLSRGRPEASVAGLRTRLANLFLSFIETPEFNPEAARFQRVPRDLSSRPNVMPIVRS